MGPRTWRGVGGALRCGGRRPSCGFLCLGAWFCFGGGGGGLGAAMGLAAAGVTPVLGGVGGQTRTCTRDGRDDGAVLMAASLFFLVGRGGEADAADWRPWRHGMPRTLARQCRLAAAMGWCGTLLGGLGCWVDYPVSWARGPPLYVLVLVVFSFCAACRSALGAVFLCCCPHAALLFFFFVLPALRSRYWWLCRG